MTEHFRPACAGHGVSFGPCSRCDIGEIALCSALGREDLQRLSGLASELSAHKGQVIIDEGARADGLFNVTSGALKIYKTLSDGRRQITGFLFTGDFLGVAMNDRYPYSAEVIEPATLCRFARSKLENLMRETPDLEHRLLTMVSNELVLAQEQMLVLGCKTAREKMASFLLNLYRRTLRRHPQATTLSLPMSRHDIADYLGLTTETVSRTFTAFKKEGVIAAPSPSSLQITDLKALERLVSGV